MGGILKINANTIGLYRSLIKSNTGTLKISNITIKNSFIKNNLCITTVTRREISNLNSLRAAVGGTIKLKKPVKKNLNISNTGNNKNGKDELDKKSLKNNISNNSSGNITSKKQYNVFLDKLLAGLAPSVSNKKINKSDSGANSIDRLVEEYNKINLPIKGYPNVGNLQGKIVPIDRFNQVFSVTRQYETQNNVRNRYFRSLRFEKPKHKRKRREMELSAKRFNAGVKRLFKLVAYARSKGY